MSNNVHKIINSNIKVIIFYAIQHNMYLLGMRKLPGQKYCNKIINKQLILSKVNINIFQ